MLVGLGIYLEHVLGIVPLEIALLGQNGAFENLLRGRQGVGGIYDHWRRLKAFLRGEKFLPGHSDL
jgi:hypothetical protein